MITVAVCDTEEKFRKNIGNSLVSYFKTKEIEYCFYEYASGEEFLLGSYPDILLLNVQLKRLSGILVKDVLNRVQAETRIIFVAENRRFIEDAFGRNVFAYLVKPINFANLSAKMDEIVEDVLERDKYTICKRGELFEKVYYKNILYIEGYGKSTKIYTKTQGDYTISGITLDKWETILKEHRFIRCGRKYIVNMRYITKVDNGIELVNQIEIPLGEVYKKEFLEAWKWNKRNKYI